jgi:hypothetical protein
VTLLPQSGIAVPPAPVREDWTANVIFIVGAPRSGTTWLAKIFDSHPDVLYRHEPDATIPPDADVTPTSVARLVRAWADDRSLRTAAKRPFFRKAWQSAPARLLRTSTAYVLQGATRFPPARRRLRGVLVPNLGEIRRSRLVVKTVAWCDGIGAVARGLPHSRILVIIRSPHAQVFSVMRGTEAKRFELRTGGHMAFHEIRAEACALSYGVDRPGFLALPAAAQYAWDWVAFNETLERSLAGLPNTRTIRYEDLCEQPEAMARELFSFAGLDWQAQTAAFVRRSVRAGGTSGYYDVFQDPAVTNNRWRTRMTPGDQTAVDDVVRLSPLAKYYPYLGDK